MWSSATGSMVLLTNSWMTIRHLHPFVANAVNNYGEIVGFG